MFRFISSIFVAMPNTCTIHFTDLQLQIVSKMRRPMWLKVLLVGANVLAYGAALLAYNLVATEATALMLVLPFLAIMTFFFLTLSRYTLWTLFGTETLVISTRSLEMRHDFGWYRPRPKAVKFRQLSALIANTRNVDGKPVGRLNFYDHNELGQSDAVITTAIELPRTELDAIVRKLNVLFFLRDNQPADNLNALLN